MAKRRLGMLVMALVFGMTVVGCASWGAPRTFVRGQASSTTIMLRQGLDPEQAFREVSFILLQNNFLTEILQPEAGFIRTNWINVHTRRGGQIDDSYQVRVSVTFNPSRTQVTLNVEARRDVNGNWHTGSDTAITEDLRTTLMMSVGN